MSEIEDAALEADIVGVVASTRVFAKVVSIPPKLGLANFDEVNARFELEIAEPTIIGLLRS